MKIEELFAGIKNRDAAAIQELFDTKYKGIIMKKAHGNKDLEDELTRTFFNYCFKTKATTLFQFQSYMGRCLTSTLKKYFSTASVKSRKEETALKQVATTASADSYSKIYKITPDTVVSVKVSKLLKKVDLQIVILREEGKSFDEIAAEVGISRRTAETKYYRAKKKLFNLLSE